MLAEHSFCAGTFLSASLARAHVTFPRSPGVVAFPAPTSQGGRRRLREVQAHVAGERRGRWPISLLWRIRGQSWVTHQLSPPSPCSPMGHGSAVSGERSQGVHVALSTRGRFRSGSVPCLPRLSALLHPCPLALLPGTAATAFSVCLTCPFTGPSYMVPPSLCPSALWAVHSGSEHAYLQVPHSLLSGLCVFNEHLLSTPNFPRH